MNRHISLFCLCVLVVGFGAGFLLGRNSSFYGQRQNYTLSSELGNGLISRGIIQEAPLLRIEKSRDGLKWSLEFMGKEKGKTEPEVRAFLRKLRTGGDTPLILDIADHLSVADVRRVIKLISEDGYTRVEIDGIICGNIPVIRPGLPTIQEVLHFL